VTDGKYVWFYNSSGSFGCWTVSGKKLWFREWTPRPIDPYTRMFQPFISGDFIYHILPEKELRKGEKKLWCFLHASNKLTGEHVWKAEDAITVHNVPSLASHQGRPAIYIGRGGPYKAPEKPYGLSLIDAQTGRAIWRYENSVSFATVNQVSGEYAYIMEGATKHKPSKKVGYMHLLNKLDGKLVKEIPLTQEMEHSVYDEASAKYVSKLVKISLNMVRFSGVFHKGYYWFVNSNESIGRINLQTDKIELVEVPVQKSKDSFIWKENPIKNDMLNSRGVFAAGDKRSALSGWSKGNTRFWPMPTVLNDKVYINSLVGLTYVIDTTVEKLDEKAILSINDLGEAGETWSGNSISFSDGMIFHRSMKELFCIQNKE
ncbi:MAG: PQQ-like beta-propeller repeat protein, partial [Lentisphaeraceae bacterium]|nr:PQQ-like beta-propeller repeat protein [Lentisphaeraceae bacterium]